MSRLAERALVRLAIFSFIATLLVLPLLPTSAWFNEFRDAQVIALHERAAVDSVLRFGEVPLWNPWYCGGIYGLGEPQSRFASPTFLLSLLFGVERAATLVVFLFAVLGMEGTYRWLRLRVDDAWAALRVAPVFALSGHFAVSYFQGWTNFFGFELVPFVLFGVTMAARGRASGVVVGALAFAVLIGFGGTFAAPLVAVAAVLEAARAIFEISPRERLRGFATLGVLVSFMLTLSAARLLPLAETLSAQPRIMAGMPGHSGKAILFSLAGRLSAESGVPSSSGAFFVGGAFLLLVFLGASDVRSLRSIALVLLYVWLAAGYARKPSLFAWLRELPVFGALRYPERFLWLAILYATEPAARALVRIPRIGARRWRLGVGTLLTLVIVGTIGAQLVTFASVARERDLGAVAVEPRESFRQARGNRWLAAHYQGLGLGSLSCWETHPITMSTRLRGDLPAEEYVADPAVGIAKRVSWSPNAIGVHASMAKAGRLLVNQNWHPGWRASIGELVSDDGLLALDLPAGEHDVTLRFRPRSAIVGALVSLSALVSLASLGVIARRRSVALRSRAALGCLALTLAPWGIFAVAFATFDEPKLPPPQMLNANGSPALVSAPAPDARKHDARFELPVVVEGTRLSGPDGFGNVAIDVFLRRTESIARKSAMFVDIVRRGEGASESSGRKSTAKGDPVAYFSADHQVVGGSFYLSDAPKNVVVHDAFGVHVGKALRGTYDVWIGFGQLSAARKQEIEQNAPSTVDRLRIGSFVVR